MLSFDSDIRPSILMTVSNDLDREYKNDENRNLLAARIWQTLEALGREVADKIIGDSHFEPSTHANLKRAAPAIIHADENLSGGFNFRKLAQIFAKRKINDYIEIQTA